MAKIDLLNREIFIDNVMQLINQLFINKKGCCFSIEGGWGIGKTFVIEEIEKKLNEIEEDKYFVFHYNCWKYDYYEEPAIAIISAMIASIQEDNAAINVEFEDTIKAGYKFVGEKLKEIAGIYIENKIGVNFIDWIEEVGKVKDNNDNSLHEFDKMFNFSQTIEKVRKKLSEISKERTIVVIVDELDRCIPQYAIRVLERLHHIFYDLDNVVVIMAIDRTQLEHSVEEMFGTRKDSASIDVEKYLKKFIDFSMILDNGIMNQSFKDKYNFYYKNFTCEKLDFENRLNEMLPKLFEGIDIRRQEKIVEKANIVNSIVCNEKIDISVLAFEMMYEVLKLWGFKKDKMEIVVVINNAQYVDLENKIGKEKIEFLKSMEKASYCDTRKNIKVVSENLYGYVFWYFANIFNENDMPYMKSGGNDEKMEKQIEIVKKYCIICEIIN